MDDSHGDTSHLTTHNELSSTNQAYHQLANGGRPTLGGKVQFLHIFGPKMEGKVGGLVPINRSCIFSTK